jgi:diaminopropionate ammonia-lyase
MEPRLPVRVLVNLNHRPDEPYGVAETAVVSLAAHRLAESEIARWPGYAPSPLVPLRGLARAHGLAAIHYKDEGSRFGLGSFKALGGPYAVMRALQRHIAATTGAHATSQDMLDRRYETVADGFTVTTATDGNHGRAVAWGAARFGCRAVIYVPHDCSRPRAEAIEAFHARVIRVEGDYDEAVRRCAADAETDCRTVIADTTAVSDGDAPRDVTQGYTVMVEEALARPDISAVTHVFVQGGVGALAAAVAGHLRERLGAAAPRIVVVEPEGAACLFESARLGHAATVVGQAHSVMAGLNCGTASPLAWRVLHRGAFAFMTIPDAVTAPFMRMLANQEYGDPPIVAGESAIAGLAGALLGRGNTHARQALGLDGDSRVLVFGTEGATDPEIYAAMVGRTAEDVRNIVNR